MLRPFVAIFFSSLILSSLASAKAPMGDLTCQSETSGSEIVISLHSPTKAHISLTRKNKKGRVDCSSRFQRKPDIPLNGAIQYAFALTKPRCAADKNSILKEARLRPQIEIEIIGPGREQKGYRAFVSWQKNSEKSRCHVLTIGPRFLDTKVSSF